MDKIEMLKQLVAQQQENALFHYTLGNEYLKQQDYEAAIVPLRRSIELNPHYTAAYRELGKALTATGKPEEAMAVYQRGIAIGEETGDLQTVKEIQVFLKRLQASNLSR